MEEMPRRRRRDKQTVSLPNRLLMLAREAEKRAAKMPPGEPRDNLLRRAQTAKTAAEFDLLLSPPTTEE
jgi:hypothetical protein